MPTPEQEKNKQEAQKPQESSKESAQNLAAQKVAVLREKDAAGVLASAEEETAPQGQEIEKNPDQQAREIADKYIKMIPEGDRRILDNDQLEMVLYAVEGTRQENEEKNIEGSHITSTTDRLGNLSNPINTALHDKKSNGEIARIMKEFADDPIQHAREMDKVGYIAESTLPESVRNAILAIILKEGDRPTQQSMRELADRIENAAEEDARTIIKTTRENVNQGGITSRDADNVRRAALRQFLEGIYPKDKIVRLAELQDITLYAGLKPVAGESHEDRVKRQEETLRANTAQLLEKYKDLLGENHSSSPEPGVYPDEFFNNIQREVRDALVQRLLESAK